MKRRKFFQSGFTLVELMVVVVIVAIFAAIAIPSYQEYIRRSQATQAQDQIQQIAMALDRHKSRNFNYQGFVMPAGMNVQPKGATGAAVKYNFTVVPGVGGQTWLITALATDPKNYNFLMSSSGVRCKNKTANLIDSASISCGRENTGREEW